VLEVVDEEQENYVMLSKRAPYSVHSIHELCENVAFWIFFHDHFRYKYI